MAIWKSLLGPGGLLPDWEPGHMGEPTNYIDFHLAVDPGNPLHAGTILQARFTVTFTIAYEHLPPKIRMPECAGGSGDEQLLSSGVPFLRTYAVPFEIGESCPWAYFLSYIPEYSDSTLIDIEAYGTGLYFEGPGPRRLLKVDGRTIDWTWVPPPPPPPPPPGGGLSPPGNRPNPPPKKPGDPKKPPGGGGGGTAGFARLVERPCGGTRPDGSPKTEIWAVWPDGSSKRVSGCS